MSCCERNVGTWDSRESGDGGKCPPGRPCVPQADFTWPAPPLPKPGTLPREAVWLHCRLVVSPLLQLARSWDMRQLAGRSHDPSVLALGTIHISAQRPGDGKRPGVKPGPWTPSKGHNKPLSALDRSRITQGGDPTPGNHLGGPAMWLQTSHPAHLAPSSLGRAPGWPQHTQWGEEGTRREGSERGR